MHYDWQLRASHLIFDCVPSYTSYQDPILALIVSSPLLSYIHIRLPEVLSRGLTVGKAWERGPCFIREGSLMLARDASAGSVFQGSDEHIPIEDPAEDFQ